MWDLFHWGPYVKVKRKMTDKRVRMVIECRVGTNRYRLNPQKDSGAYECARVMTPNKSECSVTVVVDEEAGRLGIMEGRNLSILILVID